MSATGPINFKYNPCYFGILGILQPPPGVIKMPQYYPVLTCTPLMLRNIPKIVTPPKILEKEPHESEEDWVIIDTSFKRNEIEDKNVSEEDYISDESATAC